MPRAVHETNLDFSKLKCLQPIEQNKECAYRVQAGLCASQQQSLDFSFRCRFLSRLDLSSFHLISSHRSFSWKFLIASHCHCSLCHPISSHLVSSQLFSTTSHLVSCLLSSSPLFSADHNCSHLLCHLSFSHLFSAHLASFLFNPSQILHSNAARLNSSQLSAALLMSGRLNSSHI